MEKAEPPPRRRRARGSKVPTAAAAAPSAAGDDALRVAFRTALDGAVCAALTGSAAQFLLYARGQIPCVYDELRGVVLEHQQQQEQQQSRHRKLLGGPMKKAVKCVDAAERLLRVGLPALWEGGVRSVVLIFGASVFSPREVYVIDFASHERREEETRDAPLAEEKVARLCAQKLIRALILANLAVTALHVVALAEKRVGGIPGFVPKQSFRLRLPKTRRGVTRTHHICIAGGGDNAAAAAAATAGVPSSLTPSDPSPQMLLQSSQDTHSTLASAPANETLNNSTRQEREPESGRCEPWFLRKPQVLDPDWMWYTSDRPILGFAGAL